VAGRYRPQAAQETEAALEADMWHRIAVQAPLLAVRGVLSPVFDRPRMLRLGQVVPHAVLAEVPAASHRVMQDNPRFVAALLDAHLDSTELSAPGPERMEVA
jgi:pimeloyl-ACP methyl ester carboxylesterase